MLYVHISEYLHSIAVKHCTSKHKIANPRIPGSHPNMSWWSSIKWSLYTYGSLSRLHNHCQTTTRKIVFKLATERHQRRITASCSTHVQKPRGKHGRRALYVWWTVPPAWLSQQSADDVKCLRQMSGEGFQQGTTALFHEESGRPICTAGMWLAPELASSVDHEAKGLCILTMVPCWENQMGGGIQDGLRPVLHWSRDTGNNRVAIVHLADNQCTNQGQQGMTWQRSPHAPDLT